MISDDFDISEFSEKDYKNDLLTKINNLYLTKNEIAKLEYYHIDVYQVKNFKELLATIRHLLDEMDEDDEDDELVNLYEIFSERDYYFNTNK